MADLRRFGVWAVLLAVLSVPLTGCGGPARGGVDVRAVQRMLDRRADAVLDRDESAFLAAVAPDADGYRSAQRRMFGNLADVPLAAWTYRLTGTGGFEPAQGDGHRVAAEVRLGYRLAGYDTEPVTARQRLTLTERDGRWYVAAETAPPAANGRPAARQLWDQGKVLVARGRRSLVLGVGQAPERLREMSRAADRAVPAVSDAWPGEWPRRVVVLVPGSVEGVAALLGAPASGYRGIAALTTGEVGGTGNAPADRVIVNPDAYGVLGTFGQRVVLTHETAHVAARAYTSAATPLWLSEGLADWIGYRGTGRTFQQTAPGLTRELAAGRSPGDLPGDEAFGFGRDSGQLALAYERSWLACRMIADEWGERRLTDFYRAVGTSGPGDRDRAVERALRERLGIGLKEFTARWQTYAMKHLS